MEISSNTETEPTYGHSFFPREARDLEHKINKEFDIDTSIVITPSVGLINTPNCAEISDNEIRIFPEIGGAIEKIYKENPDQFQKITNNILYASKQYLKKYEDILDTKTKENVTLIIDGIELVNYGNDDLLPIIASSVSLIGGDKNMINLYFSGVILPLFKSYPDLKKFTFEEVEESTYHEAGHAWTGKLVKGLEIDKEEFNKLKDEIITKETMETLNKLNPNKDSSKQPLDIRTARKIGLEKTKIVLEKITDPILREKVAFTFIWKGIDEEVARAITIWKFPDADELFDEELIHGYGVRVGTVVHTGNEGIKKYLQKLQEGGLAKLKTSLTRDIGDVKIIAKYLSSSQR